MASSLTYPLSPPGEQEGFNWLTTARGPSARLSLVCEPKSSGSWSHRLITLFSHQLFPCICSDMPSSCLSLKRKGFLCNNPLAVSTQLVRSDQKCLIWATSTLIMERRAEEDTALFSVKTAASGLSLWDGWIRASRCSRARSFMSPTGTSSARLHRFWLGSCR